MARSFPAQVKPALLKWARESARISLEKHADALPFDPDTIRAWEKGKGGPTISQLRKLGKTYKRPITVFFLAEPPTDFDAYQTEPEHHQHQQRFPNTMSQENTQNSSILLYEVDEQFRLEVQTDGETVWLSLNQMASLFERDKSTISRHIKNVFDEGELAMDSAVANFATTAADGKNYQVDYYTLDATSIDYEPTSETSSEFFAKVQNQLHWAAHGHTAAEIIFDRADASRANMGITNYPGHTLLKRDIEIAKNYLKEDELNLLNRIVTAYLELAEIQAFKEIEKTQPTN